MAYALDIESAIVKQDSVMSIFDPEKKVALVVDEWGTWFDVEPGTNPGFLYQQNTMRDALVAALTLNIFNNHADRVRMANIAQIVNVLQSVILTQGDQMVLTPPITSLICIRCIKTPGLSPRKWKAPHSAMASGHCLRSMPQPQSMQQVVCI